MPTPAQIEKAARFAELHRQGTFVLPNAWDIPSALLCVEAGYPAVGTSSAAVAFQAGLMDGEHIGRDRMLGVAGAMARRVPLPVTVDLESGYGEGPEAVAETVRLAILAGLIGCNIEDSDPAAHTLIEAERAAERIAAAVAAARAAGLPDFVVNARVDSFFVGMEPKDAFVDAVRRGNLYLAAGAACVFTPGPADAETARALAEALDGPLNIMAGGPRATAPITDLAQAGVRRISLGGSLMAAAYGAALSTLNQVRDTGAFEYTRASGPAFMTLARLLASNP